MKLNSSNTVTVVLSNMKVLATMQNLSFQSDLCSEDRKQLSLLLKERRKPNTNGTERKDIKLKRNTLLLKGTKYGYTDGKSFILEGADSSLTDSDLSVTSPSGASNMDS